MSNLKDFTAKELKTELESRRYNKCMSCTHNGDFVCSDCFWDAVFYLHRNDHYKAIGEKQ